MVISKPCADTRLQMDKKRQSPWSDSESASTAEYSTNRHSLKPFKPIFSFTALGYRTRVRVFTSSFW